MIMLLVLVAFIIMLQFVFSQLGRHHAFHHSR
jgi:hypothetical protein